MGYCGKLRTNMVEIDRSPELNVGSWLRDQSQRLPDHDAIIVDPTGESISYAALNLLANRAADALGSRGVDAGDRVALALPSEPLYLALYFACAKLGAIMVPLNTRLTRHELSLQIADAGAELVLDSGNVQAFFDSLCDTAEEPVLRSGGEDPQVLMYTSGTEGRPKGALLPHRKTLYNTLNAETYLDLKPDDVIVVAVPLFHSYGLKILSVPGIFAGATLILVDAFDPIGLQETVARYRATILGAVPVMYRRMLMAGMDRDKLASLRFGLSAGAPLDLATIQAFHDAGVPLKQAYGQTETSILCCLDTEDVIRKAGTVGRPVHHAKLRIASEDSSAAAVGISGEVQVQGPIRMLGYWRQPEATLAASDGTWHRTGDLGVLDEEGFLTLVGRLKDLYISGGENVYPAEVENVLESHPNVAEAAVIGVPDHEWGERGHAFIVSVDGSFDIDPLRAFAATRLAKYKLPKGWTEVAELPRTASGKIQKHLLKGLL